MEPRDHLNFIIKYQLGLAIDYQKTVNNPEYKEKIDNYFKLVTENNKLKHKRMIDEFIEKNKKKFKKYQNEQIKQKQSYDGFENKKSTKYPTNPYYFDEKINDPNRSLALLSGGDIIEEKYNQIRDAFSKISEDIKKTPEEYRFFEKDTLEYKNVETFINNIVEINKMVEDKLETIKDKDKYRSAATDFISLYMFNIYIVDLSFNLPTLKPDSNIYKKILNYIYLCIVLFDEKIFKTRDEHELLNSSFNNSIVPYACSIDKEGAIIGEPFQGSCLHISSLLSIALEEENYQLLKDFISKELWISLGQIINVNNMSLHLLLILSELLLNKGNLNFYSGIEYITYNKIQNEIVFYRSFNDYDIQELLYHEKKLVAASKPLMLISINPPKYDIDYTNKFCAKCSYITMRLYSVPDLDFNDGKLVAEFYDSKIKPFKYQPIKEKDDDKLLNYTSDLYKLPFFAFNFTDNFALGFDQHAVLMRIKDPLKGEYEIIDPNLTSYEKCPTFNIKKISDGLNVNCQTDKSSLNNLECVIKNNYPGKSIDEFINLNNDFIVIPITVYYGQLKNDLTPIRFSLDMNTNKIRPNLIKNYGYGNLFYIGNGIWVDQNYSCLTMINNNMTLLVANNDDGTNVPFPFKLLLNNYTLTFSGLDVYEIMMICNSLPLITNSQIPGGSYKNHHNLNKYLIIALIFITAIIIIAIIIKLIVNKNKIDTNEKFRYNK